MLDRDASFVDCGLKVYQLLIGRLDISTGLNLFEREVLEGETLVEKLVLPVHHVFAELSVVFDLTSHCLRRSEVEFLGYAGEGPRCFVLA